MTMAGKWQGYIVGDRGVRKSVELPSFMAHFLFNSHPDLTPLLP